MHGLLGNQCNVLVMGSLAGERRPRVFGRRRTESQQTFGRSPCRRSGIATSTEGKKRVEAVCDGDDEVTDAVGQSPAEGTEWWCEPRWAGGSRKHKLSLNASLCHHLPFNVLTASTRPAPFASCSLPLRRPLFPFRTNFSSSIIILEPN